MEIINETMHINENQVYIRRYEIMKAFFRTEEEENIEMANILSKMLSVFCKEEKKFRRNITELPFDINTHQNVINYIENTNLY